MIVPSHPFPATGYPVYTDPTVQGNLRWDDSRYPGVDILLTSDWPKGISNRTQASEVRDLGMEQNLIFSKGNECFPSGVHRGGGSSPLYFKLKLLQKQDLDILDAFNMMEDVRKAFYFLFFYFFLQSIYKGIESLAQTQM